MINVQRLALITLIGALASGSLDAQTKTSTNQLRIPVTVVLVDQPVFGGVHSVVFRRATANDGSRNDVLVLNSASVSALELSAGVRDLLTMRQQDGDTVATNQILRVRPKTDARGHTQRVLPWARRVVNDLSSAQPRFIEGLGQVRAVDIWLPRERKVSAAKTPR